MRRLLLLLVPALAASLLIAACNGDEGSEDEDQITEAIETAATSGEPSACTELQTQNFNEQTAGVPGPAATEACEEDAADTPADEVEVSNIEVDGSSATAEAALSGSILDQQTIELALVKEGEDWKLDEILGFVGFDRAAFDAGFEEELSSDEELPPDAAECVSQNFKALSDQEVQDFFLDPSEEEGNKLFGSCFGG